MNAPQSSPPLRRLPALLGILLAIGGVPLAAQVRHRLCSGVTDEVLNNEQLRAPPILESQILLSFGRMEPLKPLLFHIFFHRCGKLGE